jgi:hypothetical protein
MARRPTADDFNRINGSKYLSKDDIGDDEVTTAVTDVVVEAIPDTKGGVARDKFVVSFDAFDKPLILNAVNKNFLGAVFGKDPNDWPGNGLVVFVDNTVVFNEPRRHTPAVAAEATEEICGEKAGTVFYRSRHR